MREGPEYLYPSTPEKSKELIAVLQDTVRCLYHLHAAQKIGEAKKDLRQAVRMRMDAQKAKRWLELLVFFDNNQTVESALEVTKKQLDDLKGRAEEEAFSSENCQEVIRLIDIRHAKNPTTTNGDFMDFLQQDPARASRFSFFIENLKFRTSGEFVEEFRDFLQAKVQKMQEEKAKE